MATKGTTSGLLSKMVKFVRHPTKDWSELDKLDSIPDEPEQEPERGYSKESLKEMIERKRQNDFVRQREFDELRTLRRNAPVISAEPSGRPSFFQVTTTNTNMDERASTIKKIDEIEAQMSKQWWKGKQGKGTPEAGSSPVSINRPVPQREESPLAVRRQEEMDALATLPPPEPEGGPDQGRMTDFDATQPGFPESAGSAAAAMPGQPAAVRSSGSGQPQSGPSRFSSSNLVAIDLGDSLADTDLEEAAIRFANGDDAGAEAGLLAALQTDQARQEAVVAWLAALLDMYRATGQQASFNRVATEYAQRFDHAAPVWFSTPDLLGRNTASAPLEPVSLSRQTGPAHWHCPAELDFQTVQDLPKSLSHAPEPWHLDWSRFRSITPAAGEALADLFAQWCAQPVRLRFEGADVIEKTLRSFTPSGDKSVALFWWRLRLDALRILRQQDEFELAALDFCVTYEVSPPPWQDARCQCAFEQIHASSARSPVDESGVETVAGPFSRSDHAATEPMQIDATSASVIELSGEVLGDATEALNKLQPGVGDATRLVIACDRLIRVDFAAAGSILNWVAAREAEGRHVQFRDVPRLVAAFFNVIGISEHARVMVRAS